MIRATVEVKDENSAFSIEVYADNLRRAVEYAANRHPGYTVSVQFPLDPEVYFVEEPTAESETVEPLGSRRRPCANQERSQRSSIDVVLHCEEPGEALRTSRPAGERGRLPWRRGDHSEPQGSWARFEKGG